MVTVSSRLATAGVLFLLTLLSGVWLSNSGKPLNTLIFTVHKLIALGALIFTGVTVYQLIRAGGATPLQLGATIVSGLLFVCLFVTGALLSLGKPANEVVLTLHRVAPLMEVAAAGLAIYLLAGARA